jgi:radical SAM protein with 4Fe4S-binding SPASM domain
MKTMRPAKGWSYVAGAVNCAFYESPGGRVIQLSRELSRTVRRMAQGQPLDRALEPVPVEKRDQVAGFLQTLPCLVECSSSDPWETARTDSPEGSIEPRGAFLELTSRCNLRCAHCYADAGRPPAEPEYTTDEWLKLLDDLAAEGFAGVVLTGGEPLIRPDFSEIYRKAVEVFERRVTILTNGNLLEARLAEKIRDNHTQLSLSFYSQDASRHDELTGVPGSFDELVGAIRLLLDRGVFFSVNIVVFPRLEVDLPKIRAFLASLGVDGQRAMANPVLPAGRGCAARADIRLLRADFPHEPFRFVAGRESERLVCPTCWRGQLTITPQGRVLLCNMIRDLSVGDLRTQDLRSVVSSPECQSMWRLTLEDVEGCRECELRFACYDCRAAPKFLSGDLRGRNPLCRYNPQTGEWRMAAHSWARAQLDPSVRPRAPAGLAARKLGDEVVLCDHAGNSVFALNQVAERIWSLCDGERSVEDIVGLLLTEFEVEADRLARDVDATVAYMLEQGLLVR